MTNVIIQAKILKVNVFLNSPIISALLDNLTIEMRIIGSKIPFTAWVRSKSLICGIFGINAIMAPKRINAVKIPRNIGASRKLRERPFSKPKASLIE